MSITRHEAGSAYHEQAHWARPPLDPQICQWSVGAVSIVAGRLWAQHACCTFKGNNQDQLMCTCKYAKSCSQSLDRVVSNQEEQHSTSSIELCSLVRRSLRLE